jgi:hypothetical protein
MEAKGEAEQESARRRRTNLGKRRRAEQEEAEEDMVGVRMRQRAAATVIEKMKIDWQLEETIVVAWWGRGEVSVGLLSYLAWPGVVCPVVGPWASCMSALFHFPDNSKGTHVDTFSCF